MVLEGRISITALTALVLLSLHSHHLSFINVIQYFTITISLLNI